MPTPTPLLVLVSMFAAEPAGGITAFHLDPAAGTLTPAAATAACPHSFFLTLSPDRHTVYAVTAEQFGKAETEEVGAWRLAGPDGRFLYGTNRGHDSIAVFRVAADGQLTPVEIVPSRGHGPQHLAITPDGGLLVCANMPGGCLAVFRIDRATGRLTAVGETVPVAAPSCIALVP